MSAPQHHDASPVPTPADLARLEAPFVAIPEPDHPGDATGSGVATVAISATVGPSGSAFGIACLDFSAAVLHDQPRSAMHTLIDAFEYVLMHPHFLGLHIDVLVADEGFASAVAALLPAWPHVSVVTVGTQGYLVARASNTARALLDPHRGIDEVGGEEAEPPTTSRLTCATDGSAGYARHPAASFGWVTESGESGWGIVCGAASARAAEFAAVTDLLTQMPPARPLRVLIDCREVLDIVRAAHHSVSVGTARAHGAAGLRVSAWNERYVTRLMALLPGRDVEFVKVRGHDGHPLNECADRLSRYARRTHQMGVSDAVAKPVFERIVAEGMWAWSDFNGQGDAQDGSGPTWIGQPC